MKFNKPNQKNSGQLISSKGYRMIGHELFGLNKNGTVKKGKEHILVWRLHHNRKIPKGFSIHHLDNNKLNNKISNLILLDNIKHRQLHTETKRIGLHNA